MRPPKLTKLHLLEGNHGSHRLNHREPTPTVGCPKPDFLNSTAARVWDAIAPALLRNGLLTELDSHSLALYCLLYARVIEGKATDGIYRELRALGGLFGLDPTNRCRIVLPEKPKQQAAVAFRG
jgi:phage terminase small subunit